LRSSETHIKQLASVFNLKKTNERVITLPSIPVLQNKETEVVPIQDFFVEQKTTAQLFTDKDNRTQLKPFQLKPNNTGLPDNLKMGVENLSGMDMSDVKVHYNSSQPAQLSALAYAQGNNIHIGPGQEKYLPHEAWHLVQQRQGRVQATKQMKMGVAINDDLGLENEADVMGEKALCFRGVYSNPVQQKIANNNIGEKVVQRAKMERIGAFPAVNDEIETGGNVFQNTSATSIKVSIFEEETDLFVGQNYLNTELSRSYKLNSANIKGGNAKVNLIDDTTAAVVDGHHRVIWSLYHGVSPSYEMVTFGNSLNIGEMKYQGAPKPIHIQTQHKNIEVPKGGSKLDEDASKARSMPYAYKY
jgi:Domain of unknown function (DUF4157)